MTVLASWSHPNCRIARHSSVIKRLRVRCRAWNLGCSRPYHDVSHPARRMPELMPATGPPTKTMISAFLVVSHFVS